MKISGIELFHIAIPFAKPYRLSKAYGTLHEAQAVIFKLHTDEGIVGLGEADPMNPFTEETPGTVMSITREALAPLVLGRDPEQIPAIESILDRLVLGHPTARGAIDMALYDICGKVLGIPVHQMLGGRYHAELPILWGIGSEGPKEDLAAIEELRQRGCRTIMIKMGSLPIADEVRRMSSARRHFKDEIRFVVDPNQGWEESEALAFIEATRDFPPDLIEQPVKRWNILGLKRIRDRACCPVSADESLVSPQDAAELIRHRAVDVFSIKVSKNGGLLRSKQIAQTAETFGINCLMNSMFEFGITQAALLQVGCTLPNLVEMGHAYGSVVRMSDDVTDFGRNIKEATVRVPAGSGLGVELDQDKLNKYTREYVKI
ncbi:MAG: mandelate racemase/muconate lactonizing enzyme family protein [Hyphomicrobiales bacterium]